MKPVHHHGAHEMPDHLDRRALIKAAFGAAALGGVAMTGLFSPNVSFAASLSKAERDQMTPDQVLRMLEDGNKRFRSGTMLDHDYLAQKRASATGQYPAAAILSCIDSRAPAEILFDTAIGDAFNARVAGNVASDDLMGSLEFACGLAGAKLIVVLGHTACGAVKGAIDGAEYGHLTGLLDKIKPAVAATRYAGERTSKNAEFVDEVAKTNVRFVVNELRQRSSVLAELEREGRIKIVGAAYHLKGGRVEFLS